MGIVFGCGITVESYYKYYISVWKRTSPPDWKYDSSSSSKTVFFSKGIKKLRWIVHLPLTEKMTAPIPPFKNIFESRDWKIFKFRGGDCFYSCGITVEPLSLNSYISVWKHTPPLTENMVSSVFKNVFFSWGIEKLFSLGSVLQGPILYQVMDKGW